MRQRDNEYAEKLEKARKRAWELTRKAVDKLRTAEEQPTEGFDRFGHIIAAIASSADASYGHHAVSDELSEADFEEAARIGVEGYRQAVEDGHVWPQIVYNSSDRAGRYILQRRADVAGYGESYHYDLKPLNPPKKG